MSPVVQSLLEIWPRAEPATREKGEFQAMAARWTFCGCDTP